MKSNAFHVRLKAVLCVLALAGFAAACDDDTKTQQTADAVDVQGDTDAAVQVDPDKVVHLDLSEIPNAAGGHLHIAGKKYLIKEHTDETRALHRNLSSGLMAVEDDDMTHYVEDVELPQDRMALMWTTHEPDERGGHHRFGLVGIHVPKEPLRRARMARAAEGWPRYAHLMGPAGKADDRGDAGDPDPDNLLTPLDAAKALIFHHPELLHLDPEVASRVWTHIENTPSVLDLAYSIAMQGPATVHDDAYEDGWAVLQPILDGDGKPKMDQQGNPMYDYVFSTQTEEDAQAPLNAVLKATKNDPELRDIMYHVTDGEGGVDASKPVMMAKALKTDSAYSWTLDHTQVRSGLDFSVEPAAPSAKGRRQIRVGFENKWLRHLSAWVGFEDYQGNRLNLPADMHADDSTNQLVHLGTIPAVVTIMSIPLPADWTYFTVEVPDEALKVNLYAGGLGVGHLDYSSVANQGIVLTAVFEYGIPLFFLAAGAGLQSTQWFKDLMEDKDLVIAIMAVAPFLLAGENAAEIGLGGSPKVVLSRSASLIAGLIWSYGCKVLAAKIVEKLTESEMEGAVPFVGWAMRVLSISSTLSSLTQTTAEVLSSPFIIKNDASPSMNVEVTLKHDVNDYQFPATATRYKVYAYYVDGTPRLLADQEMPKGPDGKYLTVSDPIVVTLYDLPAGGTVDIQVAFYSDTWWLVGKGSTGRISNIVTAGADKLKAEITITELEVPLTTDTQYSHKVKLGYVNGEYVWIGADAPTQTLAALSCANVGSHLCNLNDITFSQRTGMFGYSWQAAGPNMTMCDKGTQDMQLYYVQSMSATQHPNVGYKSLNCGMSSPSGIIYELLGNADGTGSNFFIDSRNGTFHLRKVVLDTTTQMTYAGKSWGRFTQPLDDVAMRDGGYIAGANWSNSKIELLRIPDAPYEDSVAPWAVVMAGEGVREGLLHGPKAIAFTATGELLVLETINRRIQALDLDGNPVKYFKDKTEYFASLKEETNPVMYLDMGVEFSGYIYVLSYENNGNAVKDYRLDIYDPKGVFLTRTVGVAAHRMAVDFWRNVYTLNYEAIAGPGGRTEPSVSEWIPSTPEGTQP